MGIQKKKKKKKKQRWELNGSSNLPLLNREN